MSDQVNPFGIREDIEEISHNLFLYVQSVEEYRDRGYSFVEVCSEFATLIRDEVDDLPHVIWTRLADALPTDELNDSAPSIENFYLSGRYQCDGHFADCLTLDDCKIANAKAWVCDEIYMRTLELADERYEQINKKQSRI